MSAVAVGVKDVQNLRQIGADRFQDVVSEFATMGSTANSRKQRRLRAQRFISTFGDLSTWQNTGVDQRTACHVDQRGFAAWWAISDGFAVDADYIVASRTNWGRHVASRSHIFHAEFLAAAAKIKFTPQQISQQWVALATLCAISGQPPDAMTDRPFQDASDQWLAALKAAGRTSGRYPGAPPISVSTPLHGLRATLAAMAVLDTPGQRKSTRPGQPVRWEAISVAAPKLVTTMRRYLAQIALSLRPGSVAIADTSLRHLATYRVGHHREVQCVRDLRRTHIDGFKAWLANRGGYRGKPSPAPTTIGMRLGNVRTFLDRIIEWDDPDAPERNPVLLNDAPIPDRPLPRFLDDADAAALMNAARNLPDLFDRVVVETLARTGMRKGELRLLSIDAITTIGGNHWLRTPVGKLHTDRYIPLHPSVHTLLTQWREYRGDQPHTDLMFTHQGRPISQTRIDKAVHRAAAVAGIGHVTPHQLRHTLATQAINRGMSLEAIAALLGHKSMTMTMTYAKIADRTVADEYFAVTNKIEALYQPADLPADAEGPNMRALRNEVTTRLLGNGRCTRPEDLGCRYETICQTCTFFTTSIEFRDTLTAQRDDAANHNDGQRLDIYTTLVNKIGTLPT